MKEELETKLHALAPIFFRDRELPGTKSLMCYGCSCGNGWFGILRDMVLKLERVSRNYDLKIIGDQVKEKFGTLRVYYHIEYGPSWTKSAIVDRVSSLIYSLPNGVWFKWKLYRWVRGFDYICSGRYIIPSDAESELMYMQAYGGVNRIISAIVNDTEEKSGRVCENCGSDDMVSTRSDKKSGWVSTLCDECRHAKTENKEGMK